MRREIKDAVDEISLPDFSGKDFVCKDGGGILTKDYYGVDEEIFISEETKIKMVSTSLLPAIKYVKEKGVAKSVEIKFSEKILKKRGENGSGLELEIGVCSGEEYYTDTYRTIIFFDKSRMV